jgi:hypothetical protein
VGVAGDQRAVHVERVDAAAGGHRDRDLLEVLVEGDLGQLHLDVGVGFLEPLDDLEDGLTARLAARHREVLEADLVLGRDPGRPGQPGHRGGGDTAAGQTGERATGQRHGVSLLPCETG